jgi:toxin-antitoxin system PIN domain toxin
MRVVHANVLLYAVNTDAVHHAVSLEWLDSALDGEDNIGFAWNALLAFVRISTNPRIMPMALAADEAMAQVHEWLAAPSAHLLNPGERHPMILESVLKQSGTAANLVNDAHLAALAIEHRASVVTFDRDFDRFDGVRAFSPDELLRRTGRR